MKWTLNLLGLDTEGEMEKMRERLSVFLLAPYMVEEPVKPVKSTKPKIKSAKKKSSEEEEDEKPSKKVTKSPKKNDKKGPVKIALPMKKPSSASKKKRKPTDDSSDDDIPLAKKGKVPPTDVELRQVVSAILKDADLEKVTMKTVVRDVYHKYSSFDLTSRKDFIKQTVKELIS